MGFNPPGDRTLDLPGVVCFTWWAGRFPGSYPQCWHTQVTKATMHTRLTYESRTIKDVCQVVGTVDDEHHIAKQCCIRVAPQMTPL